MAAPAAAASPAIAALLAKQGSADAAGMLRSLISAMEKPIYSDATTQTVTHIAKNGDVITRTTTKGWTIPLGLPVFVILAIGAWEIGKDVSEAIKGSPIGASVSALLNPANFVQQQYSYSLGLIADVAGIFGKKLAGAGGAPANPVSIAMPASFMAHLSLAGQQLLLPFTATAGAAYQGIADGINKAQGT